MYLCVCLFSLAGTLNSSFKTQLSTFISYQIVSYLERATITHGQVGEGRGMQPPPCGSKTSPLPCGRKMGTHLKKSMVLSMVYPFFGQRSLVEYLYLYWYFNMVEGTHFFQLVLQRRKGLLSCTLPSILHSSYCHQAYTHTLEAFLCRSLCSCRK